jgi:hypothetical protein
VLHGFPNLKIKVFRPNSPLPDSTPPAGFLDSIFKIIPLAVMGKKTSKTVLENSGVQENFISRIKQLIPPGYGLAEELADILGISTDSAYRRIRGETDLTLDEIYRIGKKYPISIDDLFSNRSDTVTFGYTKLTDSAENFESYLTRVNTHLDMLRKAEDRKIYYVAEEMPLFYSFYQPLFTEFKLFYWQRSVLNIPAYQQKKFVAGLVPKKLIEIAKSCFENYFNVPSVEVWTDLTVLTGLRQVGYYFESGVIDKQMALQLLNEYRKTIEMIRTMADTGRKNISDQKETFHLYSSEVVLGTNCIYTMMGEARYSYISFNTLNSLTTTNPEFCSETEHWMRNLERRSTLISGVGEKQRYQFFNSMFSKIDLEIERTANS